MGAGVILWTAPSHVLADFTGLGGATYFGEDHG
jgi:hypothetical protein